MSPWKPSLQPGVDLRALPLSPEEGFVASRIDGATDIHQLALVTGVAEEQLLPLLERLVDLAAVTPPEIHEAPPESESQGGDEGTHRKLFESRLHPLTVEERMALARTAVEPELSAFCFDPVLQVIQSLLGNASLGLVHARLIATHHRTAPGLEQLVARPAFAMDAGVRRAILRNPQLHAAQFRKLFAGTRLSEQFKIVISREVTEQTRHTAREVFRARFSSAAAEERVELLFKTEGRCLPSLSGLGFDGKTTALLCGRTFSSTTLVQNFARFSATPPALIAHLLKQELVRRSPTLRSLLERHPHAPSSRPA